MNIRKAEEKDIDQILEIYNFEVLNSTSTFDLTPKTKAEQKEWFCNHNKDNHPLIVAEENNKICGYASLSAYREKEAYKSCVELSIYVAADYRNKGIASVLMSELLSIARNDKSTHTVVSVITSGNKASQKLHKKFDFEFCGTIKNVGIKFGKNLSIDNYRLDT